jgi:transposase
LSAGVALTTLRLRLRGLSLALAISAILGTGMLVSACGTVAGAGQDGAGSIRPGYFPGVGPIGAVLLTMKTPEPELFRSGRQFAAWIGLTPKDHSTAGKLRLGGITRAGDEGLRSVLVVGATTVIQHAQRGGRPSPWLTELLKRRSPKLAAVALANKTARIAWKLMGTGENYAAAKAAPATLAGAA